MARSNEASASGVVKQEQHVVVAASCEAVWALLADTNRLNRELNLPPVAYQSVGRPEGGSHLHGTAKIGGQWFHYREEPYCWVQNERWSVRRFIDEGPVSVIRPGVDLEALPGGGTRVRAFFEATPRNPAQRPLAEIVARSGVRGIARACRAFDRFLQGRAATPYPQTSTRFPADKARLDDGVVTLQELGAVPHQAVRLAEHLQASAVEDVLAFRPYLLADRWQLPRLDVLRLCLLAVRAGLLDMRWRVLCPACRTAGEALPHLSNLSREAHCPSCNIVWGPEFDRSVEVCFSVAPRIRQSPFGDAHFCIGGPSRVPHVALQQHLPPSDQIEVAVSLAPGVYRLTSPQVQGAETVTVAPGGQMAPHCRIVVKNGQAEWDRDPTPIAPHSVWTWKNKTNFATLVRLEVSSPASDVATAADVTCMQAFRDFFGSEVLSPGAELAVRQIALLFTDLKGSTQLYTERGDAASYALVREHFRLVRGAVERFGGGIVKTAGDAAMCAFPDAASALDAALVIQQAQEKGPSLPVKIGIHAGPALAVNADGALDYFGHIVNEAARLQTQSKGGDIVLSAELARDAGVKERMKHLTVEPFTAKLRGVGQPMSLLRIFPHSKVSNVPDALPGS